MKMLLQQQKLLLKKVLYQVAELHLSMLFQRLQSFLKLLLVMKRQVFRLLLKSLEEPIRQIAANAGLEGS